MDGDLELLGERIAEHSAHLDAALHRLLTDLRAFDQRGGWHLQGAVSCAHWLSWRVGWTLVTAREHVRVAGRLGELPTIDDALRRGQVSYAKVRAMVRVATPANEALLLAYAQLMTASQLEIQCRRYALVLRHGDKPDPLTDAQLRYVRRRDTEAGMVKIEAVLHPEEAELVWTMINHAATQRSRRPDQAVSSDSTEAPVTYTPRAVEPTSGSERAADRVDDSAELPSAQARCIDDSAESRMVTSSAAAVTALTAETACGLDELTSPSGNGKSDGVRDDVAGLRVIEAIDDSAESLAIAASTRLHGVLDEVTAPDRPGDGRKPESRVTRGEPDSRPVSVLREREDAGKRAFDRADALVSVAQGYLRGERPERSPIEIVLTISDSALRADSVDPIEVGEIGQSFVSAETGRRLSCDAGIVEVLEDAFATPLSVGRKRRTISGALKRALYQRDQCCTFPGCDHRIFLEGHHIKHWADGGETSLLNTALLCGFHHRYVHEYGYSIELGPDGRPRFRDPRGRLVKQVPERPLPVDLGWPRIRAMNEPLAITADAITCWDGTPVDYGTIVGHLLAADGLTC